jgi:hypothetical protein
MMALQRYRKLSEIVTALGPTGSLARRLHCRQEQRH